MVHDFFLSFSCLDAIIVILKYGDLCVAYPRRCVINRNTE